MISVTFDRASLSLAPLVITAHPADGSLYLPEDGVGQIQRSLRRLYAPDSAWVAGRALLAAVEDASAVPLTIYAHATDSAALAAAKAVLDAAAGQWDYDLTLTIDGVAQTWRAEPEIPSWTAPDSGMVAAHLDRAALTIPVNPT